MATLAMNDVKVSLHAALFVFGTPRLADVVDLAVS